jgi:hypothetical protein
MDGSVPLSGDLDPGTYHTMPVNQQQRAASDGFELSATMGA